MAFSLSRRLPPRGALEPAGPVTKRDPPAVEAGVFYAIGDIHGRAGLLAILLDRIRQAEIDTPAAELTLIFLGDFVDRGAQSAEVIDTLIGLMESGWCRVVALKGNHEEMMLRFLEGGQIGPEWLKLGGSATLRSYGVGIPAPGAPREAWGAMRAAFANAVPDAHLRFLNSLQLYYVSGDYVFVHAGVKPDVPLAEQSERDMLWIRGEFRRCERPIDKVVVYGHTPSASPVIEDWKIGLDTGAYASGVLTGMRLEGTKRRLVQAS